MVNTLRSNLCRARNQVWVKDGCRNDVRRKVKPVTLNHMVLRCLQYYRPRSSLAALHSWPPAKYLARQYFRHSLSKAYPLIQGKTLQSLRRVTKDRVELQELICNAGFIPASGGYISVAKNQRFSYGDEIGEGESRELAHKRLTDDGERILYRIDFDGNWCIKTLQKLTVVVDGRKIDPVRLIEDIRLIVYRDSILAFANVANGNGPLLGVLKKDTILLRSAVANVSAPQKNWMPFEYEECVYLEYSIQPHVILRFDLDSAQCKQAYCTTAESASFPSDVHGGPCYLHGGAPALRLNDDFFLGVGNARYLYWFQDRYYAAVFYLFEAKPPFRVVKATQPLRVQSRVERIQYICGLAFGEDKQSLILSIGICDCDNRFVLVSLDQVLALLEPIGIDFDVICWWALDSRGSTSDCKTGLFRRPGDCGQPLGQCGRVGRHCPRTCRRLRTLRASRCPCPPRHDRIMLRRHATNSI